METIPDSSDPEKQAMGDHIDFEYQHSTMARIEAHYESRRSHKRSHSMATFSKSAIGASGDLLDQGNVAHEQVMEALRAKIQRARNQSGPPAIRNQAPLRHRRSHSAVTHRRKGERSSRSPSSDSLSIAGDFSCSPHQETSTLVDMDMTRDPPLTSLSPIQDVDTTLTDFLYNTSSAIKDPESNRRSLSPS